MEGRTRPAEVLETHIGVVLLLGSRAYKVKKPVDLGFVDFATVEKRREACRREVELNRRMSPDVYLGVAELHGPGSSSEPVVVMRRMAAEERLSTLVRTGRDVGPALRQLAKQLATLHGQSVSDPAIDGQGGRECLLARWRASFEQVTPYLGTLLDEQETAETRQLVERFLAGRAELFSERIQSGCVVDGHGDLIADDVYCTPRGPRALDCLEFDDLLRYVDRIDDAAFLAMDLERLGAPHLAQSFLGAYQEYAADTAPDSLVHHYVAYRAFVRAKVACFQHVAGTPCTGQAAHLARIAHQHLAQHEVTMILVGGPPGTGKSTVAAGLADRGGLVHLESDRIRKELAGLPAESSAAAAWGEGLYRPSWTDRTYAEMLHRADALLRRGESVVLDASWTDPRRRQEARLVARAASCPVVEIRCDCGSALADRRIAGRTGSSDADAGVAHHLRYDAAPWPEAHALDTTAGPECAIEQATVWLPWAPAPVERRRRSRLAPD